LPGIALTFEGKDRDVMKDKPRDPKESILSKNMKKFITFVSILFGISALSFYVIAEKFSGWDLSTVRTALFVFMSVDSLLFTLSIRDYHRTIFRKGLFSNQYLNFSILFGFLLLLIAVYIPELRGVLKTTELGLNHWAWVFGVAFSEILIIELAKRRIFDRFE
jgi:Ca2+-transporting ATPase